MSDKIKELAKQATDWCVQNAQGTPVAWEWELKFAELIVQEVVAVIDDHDNDSGDEWDEAVKTVSHRVKQHFGM